MYEIYGYLNCGFKTSYTDRSYWRFVLYYWRIKLQDFEVIVDDC